ncbi:MAG: hypothetical protein ACPKPY_08520 [Nitrososphaeraceae archaeon]
MKKNSRHSINNSSKSKSNNNKGKNKKYDYNKPLGKCMICYTISGWHCYDCGNDFCATHFHLHKENNSCFTS